MMSNHDDRPGGSGLLLGAGAALLMVACCALLPILIAGGDDPFLPAQFAGLLASLFGMFAGSLMPQYVHHDPHIHDQLRHGHHAAAGTHHVNEHIHHHA